jgi:hypothetical protein
MVTGSSLGATTLDVWPSARTMCTTMAGCAVVCDNVASGGAEFAMAAVSTMAALALSPRARTRPPGAAWRRRVGLAAAVVEVAGLLAP